MAARTALLIATTESDDPDLRPLAATESETHELAALLQSPDVAGFDVRIAIDQPASANLERIETFFADCEPDDLLVFYYAGHSLLDADGTLYFAMRDTKRDRLASTAVSAAWVRDLLSRSRSRQVVVLLDCSFSGAFVRGMK